MKPDAASVSAVARELLDDWHDDHNWARDAKYRLELALHQEDGCPTYRRDCSLCVARVEAEARG